jgi:hypothetical protein
MMILSLGFPLMCRLKKIREGSCEIIPTSSPNLINTETQVIEATELAKPLGNS